MRFQIFLGLFVVLLTAARSEDDDWSSQEQTCIEELELNSTEIYDLGKKRISPEDNVLLNEFLACVWKKKELQNEDGVINWVKVQQLLAEIFKETFGDNFGEKDITAATIVDAVVDYCKHQKLEGETHGQTVIKIRNCLIKGINDAMAEVQKPSKL